MRDGTDRSWLLCNVALFLVQLSASVNVSLSRTAFSWFDPQHQEAASPVVFGTVRSVFALVLFVGVRFYWRWKYVSAERHRRDGRSVDGDPPGEREGMQSTAGGLVVSESIVSTIGVISPVTNAPPSLGPPHDGGLIGAPTAADKASTSDENNSPEAQRAAYMSSVDVSHSDRLRIMGLGVIGIPVNLVCFLEAVSRTDGITTGAFASTIPVCCFVLARLLGVERMSRTKVFAVACVVLGNCIMVEVWRMFSSSGSTSEHSLSYYYGCVFFVGNVVAWSWYLVLQKPLLKRVHRLEFLFWLYVGGVTVLVAFAVATDGRTLARQLFTPGLLSGWSWLSMSYAGVVNATLPYWLLAYGIEHGGPVLASAWNATQPVLLTIASLTFLGETLSQSKAAGGAIVLVGVVLTVIAHAEANKATVPSKRHEEMKAESPRNAELLDDLSLC
jgi:drug/metabolite transporter (DMT)-like permease